MRIVPILLACAAVCLQLVGSLRAEDSRQAKIASQIDAYLEARPGFSGVVLFADAGEVQLSQGYGWANRDRQIPFSPRTAFDIGSITKQFTGAAIAKLQMQGKLDANDRLTKFFKNVPSDKQGITLFHLLTHGSGLRGDFGDDYAPVSRARIVELALDSHLMFKPGRRHYYSNAGFSLLAAVIEEITGEPYEAYCRRELWLPAGMKDTGYLLPQWQAEQLAHGYRGDEDLGTPLDQRWDTDGPYWNLRGNGGVLSTAEDLYRWHRALEGNKILSADAKRRMYDRRVLEAPDAWYSYGWVLKDSAAGEPIAEHNGGNGIFFAHFRRHLADDRVLIVGSNRTEDASGAYVRDLLQIVAGDER